MLTNKKILLCVTGGIAVYKAVDLTSKLTQEGAHVKVMMTESAQKFVSPLTFQAISRHPVYTDTFDEKDPSVIAHIDLADWADFIVIAPATANMIGKLANGFADDMVSTTILATKAPVYVAPAMNVDMYAHPAVTSNMQTLESFGFKFIEPGEGYLACGYVGKGRLEEPASIVQVLKKTMTREQILKGKTVLITAGPTREVLDPVRFFTNRSTGKMGFALAEAAAQLGAHVILIAGPTAEVINHPHIKRIDVVSAQDMYEAVMAHLDQADIVVKSAAVADYRPKQTFDEKMKKQADDMVVEMERTTDILQEVGQKKTKQYVVGFAAETNQALAYGASKLEKKHLDAIIINDVSQAGAGFGTDTNIAVFMNKAKETKDLPLSSKRDMAFTIFQLIDQDVKGE